MRKVLNSKNGYSLFLEKIDDDNIECIAFKTGIPMNSADIAKNLKVSRSAVSQSLKRSIKKIYDRLSNKNKSLSSIEIICIMAELFNVKSQLEYKKFFNLFPEKVKGEVYDDARETGYIH